ncbi:hypothetical protein SALBM135S_04843 [Streptomyces alboniger]
MLEKISAKAKDESPRVTHVGPDGAGHFVKMVHNGIEYADMQLIGEAYQLLRDVAGYPPARIADIFRAWNTGRLDSYLIEITAEVLSHVDAATGKPFVDVVQDQAEQKGTGRWTVQIALDLGVPVSGIAEAVFARSLSGHADLRAASKGLAGPTAEPLDASEAAAFADRVEQALYASKIVSYTQGFHEIAAGSETYDWNIDLGAVAGIWRGGCIIRAAFLDRITAAYEAEPGLVSLLSDKGFADEIAGAQDDWRAVLVAATTQGVPTPGFAAALAYYDALRAERLPARPHPGPARLLRRPHLPQVRQGGHVPHALGRRPLGDRRLGRPRRADTHPPSPTSSVRRRPASPWGFSPPGAAGHHRMVHGPGRAAGTPTDVGSRQGSLTLRRVP